MTKRESSSSGVSDDSELFACEDAKPSSEVVLNKYNMAAEIVNTVLKELIAETKGRVDVGYLCSLGDKRLLELTGELQEIAQKGIAMPTCVSVDNCVCHFSPLSSEPKVELKNGQLVKFDLGAHVDGFIATAAHTIVVGASREQKVTGKKANVMFAAYNALELALRMLRPEKGFKNVDVTDHTIQLCKLYGTTPVENMLWHEMERFKTIGAKQIIQNPTDERKLKMEKYTFQNFEVYAIDVLVSTGEGKAKTMDARTTVYKETDDMLLKEKKFETKASRVFFSEVRLKFGAMPFSLRLFDDEVKAEMDVLECERHGLLTPYPVLYEREGEYVAHFKATAILMPSGIFKLTGLPLDVKALRCDVKVKDEELLTLLLEPLYSTLSRVTVLKTVDQCTARKAERSPQNLLNAAVKHFLDDGCPRNIWLSAEAVIESFLLALRIFCHNNEFNFKERSAAEHVINFLYETFKEVKILNRWCSMSSLRRYYEDEDDILDAMPREFMWDYFEKSQEFSDALYQIHESKQFRLVAFKIYLSGMRVRATDLFVFY